MSATAKSNALGEIQAERDLKMLEAAYFDTPDYDAIVSSDNKVLVIGRRGTGKSALTYKLDQLWKNQANKNAVKLLPNDDQMIGVRHILQKCNGHFNYTQVATKLAWKIVLILQALKLFSSHYKFNHIRSSNLIRAYLQDWIRPNENIATLLRRILESGLSADKSPEGLIGDLAGQLNTNQLTDWLVDVSQEVPLTVYLLIDRIDEGYIPDDTGAAIVAGIVQATIEINNSFKAVRPIIFIRDNIFRALALKDENYSRNIEGSEIRLRWSQDQLLQLVARRLKVAFNIQEDTPLKAWNVFTAYDLKGREGFEKCLRLTLYRPRDLLSLLNEAIFQASKNNRITIVGNDIEATAKSISETRLNDLIREYEGVMPCIGVLVTAFKNAQQQIPLDAAFLLLQRIMDTDNPDPKVKQDLLILQEPRQAIRSLYSVGFIGIGTTSAKDFTYCHDGRSPDLTLDKKAVIMVHPCYWMALDISASGIEPELASEIHDDQELDLRTFEPEARKKLLGQMISRIQEIPTGPEGANDFEKWCFDSLKLLFATALLNIELHPNKNAPQRRDIVATNPARSEFWNRVLNDYLTRQVIFEIKNYAELGAEDFQQMVSYLTDKYGKLGFMITRTESKEPSKDRDLRRIREVYKDHDGRLIVVLSYRLIIEYLSKIRNPKKYSHVEESLGKILDAYHRMYLNEKS